MIRNNTKNMNNIGISNKSNNKYNNKNPCNAVKLSIQCIIMIILLTSVVYAAGRSSTAVPIVKSGWTSVNCDDKIILKERVHCRLESTSSQKGGLPEVCRKAKNETYCTDTYNAAAVCYEKSASEKAQCLRDTVNLGAIKQAEAKKRRYYIALLLYELEERVEKRYDDEMIYAETAAEIITLIEEAKIVSLSASKAELKTKLQEVKEAYKKVMDS